MILLQGLARKGHKVSRYKMHFCQQEDEHLGYIVTSGFLMILELYFCYCKSFLSSKTKAKQNKTQLRGFLELTTYCLTLCKFKQEQPDPTQLDLKKNAATEAYQVLH